MNKKMFLLVGAVTILGAGAMFAPVAFAQNNEPYNPVASLVQKISDKFGLNKDEVQKVFDEHHGEMRLKMQTKHEERLDKFVAEGKITAEQKTRILNKLKELHEKKMATKDSFKDMTPEQRRAEMEAIKAELEAWAKENGIDPQYVTGKFTIKIKGMGHMIYK